MKSYPNGQPTDRQILGFQMAFARHYLNSGGPTSRLEDNLHKIGSHYGRETEVFATPTGVFVTLNDPATSDDPTTALTRIRETGTKNIFIAGDVGLNVKLHMELLKSDPEIKLYAPSFPNDAGLVYVAACACACGYGVAKEP